MKAKKFFTGMSAVTLAAIMLTAVSASAAEADAPEADVPAVEASSTAPAEDTSEAPADEDSKADEADEESKAEEAPVEDTASDAPADSSEAETAEPEKEPFSAVVDGDDLIAGETDEKGSTVVIVPADEVADLPEGEKVGITVDFDTLDTYYDPDSTTTTTGPALKKANIAFVVDTTGSMASYINNVKSNLADFVKGLKDMGVEPTMSVIEYRDILEDGAHTTIFHDIDGAKWSTDVDAVIATFDKLTVGGGGDLPETTLDAFDKLFEEDPTWYKMEGSSFVFVLTDAATKEGEGASATGRTMAEWGDIMAKNGIEVSVVSNSSKKEGYEALFGKTGGSFFNITGSSYGDLMLEYATNISTHIDHTVPYTDRSITLANLKKYAVSSTGTGSVTFILTPEEAKTLLGADATDEYLSKFVFKLHGVDVIKVTITTDTEDMTETEGVTGVPSASTPAAPAAKDPDANPETGSSTKSMAAVLALAGAIVMTKRVKKD